MLIRDLIKESTVRAGFPRRQPVQGEIQETALKFLQGIVSRYNNDNYLAFTQVQVDLPRYRKIHIYDEDNTLAGQYNRYFKTTTELLSAENYPTEEDFDNGVWANAADNPGSIYDVQRVAENTYRFVVKSDIDPFEPRYQQMCNYAACYHIHLKDVAKLNTFMVKYPSENCLKMDFKPRDEFDQYVQNCPIWTFTPRGEGEWIIETKKFVVDSAQSFRLSYNRSIHIDIDTDLRVPDAYLELLIVSLTVKLAEKYPRLDDSHIARLQADLKEMITNVATPKAEGKMILRDVDYSPNKFTQYDILSGRCLFR